MSFDRENGRMSSVEWSKWALVVACLLFFADSYFFPKKDEIIQLPVKQAPMKQSRSDKAFLCKHWEDCALLQQVIVYEARSEPLDGKRLVAKVVLNRVSHTSWPNTIQEVVHEPYQFSYLQDMHKQRTPTEEDWIEAGAVAYNVLHGIVEVDSDATFYHTKAVNPFWAKHKEVVAQVGQHVFYSGSK